MSSGLIQIVENGEQDVVLTQSPNITLWRVVHRRFTNFSTESEFVVSNMPIVNSIRPMGPNRKCLTQNEKFARIKKVKINELREITKTSDSEELICSICYDDYSDINNEIVLLQCNHHYHENCLKQWLCTYNYNCPYCRTSVEELRINYADEIKSEEAI